MVFVISYGQMVLLISILWLAVRLANLRRAGRLSLRREAKLLLVYICLIVVVRFTFCPFGTVDGHIQPLLFDSSRIFPLWLNFEPFVHLFDYTEDRAALVNLFGNIALFVPLGIVWPAVFRKLDRPIKVMAAGFGVSLCIEVLQLPFYGRASDVDDLILNTAGYLLGYGIFLLAGRLRRQA